MHQTVCARGVHLCCTVGAKKSSQTKVIENVIRIQSRSRVSNQRPFDHKQITLPTELLGHLINTHRIHQMQAGSGLKIDPAWVDEAGRPNRPETVSGAPSRLGAVLHGGRSASISYAEHNAGHLCIY